MNDKNLHIDNSGNPGEEEKFFGMSEPAYNKTKDEVLNNIFNEVESENQAFKTRRSYPLLYSAAAVILVLISVSLIMRFYTININSPRGEHMAYTLPDNSNVILNAESQLSFHPYWWFLTREVKLEGEAFFEVTKVEKFDVKSYMGTTSVLGTSFNVFARSNVYKVDCFTGKVKIKSNTREELILTPSYSAEVQDDGSIKLSKFSENKNEKDWVNNMFNFNAVPFKKVLAEVERQFNIKIETDITDEFIYTGNFSANRSIDETLNLLCKPFGLEYEKINNKVYRLK
ncbi:MAG: iron dicitrate transport regulator FecR [Marinilabiliales bacterium]|nr:MAG: iron dicitrate transport regulator FecR [Marinilabiliales bacterium]